jgi:hypothetical protein
VGYALVGFEEFFHVFNQTNHNQFRIDNLIAGLIMLFR